MLGQPHPTGGQLTQLGRSAFEPDPALVEDHDPVAHGGHIVGLVGGEQHRVLGRHLGDDFAEAQSLLGIEPRRGLVEDEQLGPAQQRR